MWSLKLLTKAYKGTQDYRLALETRLDYDRVNDSVTNLNNKQEIAVMEIQKDKEISDRRQREMEARQEHRHNLQYLGMGHPQAVKPLASALQKRYFTPQLVFSAGRF